LQIARFLQNSSLKILEKKGAYNKKRKSFEDLSFEIKIILTKKFSNLFILYNNWRKGNYRNYPQSG